MAAGLSWVDHDLVVATRTGTPVAPGNFDQTLERLVAAAGVRRLTSHGLRHTAATHMVRHADDVGEIRAAAELLGYSPDVLMRTYAHVLREFVRTVTEKIGRRTQAHTDSASKRRSGGSTWCAASSSRAGRCRTVQHSSERWLHRHLRITVRGYGTWDTEDGGPDDCGDGH